MKINRESAVLLILFGMITLANPSLWWLMFLIGPIVFMSMRDNDSEEKRRERRRAHRPQSAARGWWDDNKPRERRSRGDDRRQTVSRDTRRYSNPTISPASAPSRPAALSAARRDDTPLSHALEAVEAAGHAPDDLALLPVDIGFVAYADGQRPVVHREAPIPDTVDFIQPYVELYLERAAAGNLRFEIVDGAGEVHYLREERHQLKAGRTPVIPGTRMPVGDFLYTDADWRLRVYAANTLIAEHRFGWIDPDSGTALREHLSEDGELSTDLEMLVEDARLQPMSLDELLSADAPPAARNSRAG